MIQSVSKSVYNFLIGYHISLSRIVEEIPGLSKQYDMEFFRNLENKCGIRLENIVYYKVQQKSPSVDFFLQRTSPTTL